MLYFNIAILLLVIMYFVLVTILSKSEKIRLVGISIILICTMLFVKYVDDNTMTNPPYYYVEKIEPYGNQYLIYITSGNKSHKEKILVDSLKFSIGDTIYFKK